MWAFVFFFVNSGFRLNFPMDAIFAPALSYYCIVNTDLNWGRWGLQVFKGCSGFFCEILDELLHSWGNFARSVNLGKVQFQVSIVAQMDPFRCHGLFLSCAKVSLDCAWCVTFYSRSSLIQVLFKLFLDPTSLAVIRPLCGKWKWPNLA